MEEDKRDFIKAMPKEMKPASMSQPVIQTASPLKPEGKKRSKKKIALYTILVFLGMFVVVQYFNASKYEALVQVIQEDKIGVNPTGDRLDFGDLPRDKNSVRTVILTNNSPYKANSYIMVWKFGDISDLIQVSKNNFTLKPGQTEKLEFSLHVPNSAEYRYYKGRVWIFQLPKPW